jgi:microcystin-dependent protein
MSQPFLGEIRIFAGSFAPVGWNFCNGQLVSISENSALFALLGTTYGGDGQVTFALPDCRGRVPLHQGTGPGLSLRNIGSQGGTEAESLTVNQIPAHSHILVGTSASANAATAAGNSLANSVSGSSYHSGVGRGSTPAPMNAGALSSSGGSQAHDNVAPSLCVNFIIAIEGTFPSRS